MVNRTGKNGSGSKNYPPDEILAASLRKYALQKLSQNEKLDRLARDHELVIKKTKLNELEREFNISSVKRPNMTEEELKQAVIDEAAKDISQRNGPNHIKDKLRTIQEVFVARDTVRQILRENFPEGAAKRFPGYRRQVTKRQPLTAMGPYHEVAADGHEKIGALALQMGGLGLPIYGYRDKWSGKLLKLDVVPDCRSKGVIGHLFLDLVESLGGIPLQLNLDKGGEAGWQIAFQTVLRELYSPAIDSDVYGAVALLQSIHNIIIEALWRWLREKTGHNLRLAILFGKDNGLIDPRLEHHRNLFYWIFVPLVQKELNDFRHWWNLRHVRYQADKILPSNHVPNDAVDHPEIYGGIDCLVRVPDSAVSHLRDILTEEEGPKEMFNLFYPPAFDLYAQDILKSIHNPVITITSAWNVFTEMSHVMEGSPADALLMRQIQLDFEFYGYCMGYSDAGDMILGSYES